MEEEINSRKITDLIYEQDRLLWKDSINQAISNKEENRKFQCRFLTKEGAILYCEVYLSAFGGDKQNSQDSFIHAVIADNTEQTIATNKLKERLEFFQVFS